MSVRLAGPPAIDDQTYRRTRAIVYTVPMQVHNGTDRPQRFTFGQADLRAVAPGQLLLLVTSFADAGKSKVAERQGIIRLYR